MTKINFKQGWVKNPNTGVTKDIVVKAKWENTLSDVLIGGGLVVAGILYLTSTAFVHGANAFEKAEMQALSEAGLLGKADNANG